MADARVTAHELQPPLPQDREGRYTGNVGTSRLSEIPAPLATDWNAKYNRKAACGSPSTTDSCEPRQVRKGAAVAALMCVGGTLSQGAKN